LGINSKGSTQSTLLHNPPPKPQTTIGNDYICSLLASTATAAATAADSQWQLVCHWSGRPKLSWAYSSCSNVTDEAWGVEV